MEDVSRSPTTGGGEGNLHVASASTKKPAGRWGSTFWRDCQPMHQRPELESKNSSGYKNEEGSENDLSEVEKARKGQNVDEMLSDDYYEQEEDHGYFLRHKLLNNNTDRYGSIPQSNFTAAASNNFVRGKKPKVSYDDEYEDNFEDEDEDVDEDDPDDADFDPDFGTASIGRENKAINFTLFQLCDF
ncbi:protein CHROMATIN REMODELING 5-like [Bidens hawaiensis]|uniref:protein CHROMATIN REMODELING 5-like n=1 Tax=Bidens hawaiensis TaxID=980011 RepID=UPI00404ABCCC